MQICRSPHKGLSRFSELVSLAVTHLGGRPGTSGVPLIADELAALRKLRPDWRCEHEKSVSYAEQSQERLGSKRR